MSALLVIAPAKVNLHLAVGAVRPDGYHDVTTVLHALELADEVRVTPASSLLLEAPDLGVAPEQNLAHRAAVALGRTLGKRPDVHITLVKRIPHQAGLGGGSSDAAAVIFGLATLWGIDPGSPECLETAATLGADVPFFLTGACALMTGRGDVLERVLPPLAGSPVVVVRPPHPVPTPAAYAAFDAAPQPAPDAHELISALEVGSVACSAASLANNLEAASAAVVPEVGEAVAWLRGSAGCLGAAVAGSGSAVFGLMDSAGSAEAIAARAADRGWWSAATALAAEGVHARDERAGDTC